MELYSLDSEDRIVLYYMHLWSNHSHIGPRTTQHVRSGHRSEQSVSKTMKSWSPNIFQRWLTARFDVRFAHAFEPVKAGRPIISNAVWLSRNCESKTADCWYIDPFEEKIEVESIGKAKDWRILNEHKETWLSPTRRPTHIPCVCIINYHDHDIAQDISSPWIG